MCWYCDDLVAVQAVSQYVGRLIAYFALGGYKPDADVALALRIVSRMAQSKDVVQASEARDQIAGKRLANLALTEALEFVKMYPNAHFSKETIKEIVAAIVAGFERHDAPLSNTVCCAMQSLSDVLLRRTNGDVDALTDDAAFNRIIEENVMLFNAEKQFNGNPDSLPN